VVAQIPNIGGHRNGHRLFNAAQRWELEERFALDRIQRLSGAAPAEIPLVATDPNTLAAMPPTVDRRYLRAVEAATPTWRTE